MVSLAFVDRPDNADEERAVRSFDSSWQGRRVCAVRVTGLPRDFKRVVHCNAQVAQNQHVQTAQEFPRPEIAR